MWLRFALLVLLGLFALGCSRQEKTGAAPTPTEKLPAEVKGDPESALPKGKRP